MSKLQQKDSYHLLVQTIDSIYQSRRINAVRTVHRELVKSHWEIGKYIVEFEQKGNSKSEFGSKLLNNLSKDLSLLHGKGFSKSNLVYMRLFYMKYPIGETVSHQLTWSHYFELLKIENDLERGFYEKQSILESWSVRELKRQKKTALFLRLAATTDKKGLLKLASEGRKIETAEDIIRAPYVLDFLKIAEPSHWSESELEEKLIDHLQYFLLELGKGFAFIGRQYRVTLNNIHFEWT